MTVSRKILLLVAMIMAIHAGASQLVPATASGFAYVGRVSHTYRPGAVAWTYPGVQIRCTFSGTSAAMKTNSDCGYFMVEVDDIAPHKVQVMKGDGITRLANGLPEGEHSLTLTYIIEGHGKKPTFYGLLLDDGCSLGERPTLPDRRIEFIGNSITCGYGIEGDGTGKTFLFSKQKASDSTATTQGRFPSKSCPMSIRTRSTPHKGSNGTFRSSSPTWCA